MIKAKYHKAYLLDKRKEELENALEEYPEDDLERIKMA